MKVKKMFLVFVLVSLLGLVAACGNMGNNDSNNQNAQNNNQNSQNNNQAKEDDMKETSFPIVDEKITLDFFAAEAPAAPDWNDDYSVWNEYEEMTNIEINWVEQILAGDIAEKRNLALAGGNLPDVFYATGISNADLLKYGEQGTFVNLKDLINDYAPNLKKIFDENPEIESGLTFPDGNIYGLPNIKDKEFVSMSMGPKPWIDQKWLDRLDMEVPTTTEEFYEFLTAVKKEDSKIIPFGAPNINYLVNYMKGSFGINNTGILAGNVDLDPEGDGLRFIPTADKYRELLQYMNKLYEEELIPSNIFSMEWNQFLSDAGEGNLASMIFYNPGNSIGGEVSESFISLLPLEGPDGDQLYSYIMSPLAHTGQFVITDKNEYPAETMRWVDYFYGDEGSKLMFIGLDGEAYTEVDGEYEYTDAMLEGGGRPADNIKEFVPGAGLNAPAIVKEEYFFGSESMPDSIEAADNVEPYLPEEIWPTFTYTKEENDFMNGAGNDIDKFVTEKRDQFISGDESLDDENWNKYVETLESMNIDEYTQIIEEAYNRYSE